MTERSQTQGRVWLITGASSGFGHALALAAAATGDTVVATGRNADALAALSAQAPERIRPLVSDVTDVTAAAGVVARVVEEHGRIDVLVNNAGRGQVGAVEDTTDDEHVHVRAGWLPRAGADGRPRAAC